MRTLYYLRAEWSSDTKAHRISALHVKPGLTPGATDTSYMRPRLSQWVVLEGGGARASVHTVHAVVPVCSQLAKGQLSVWGTLQVSSGSSHTTAAAVVAASLSRRCLV
jgi:hypothetical protein